MSVASYCSERSKRKPTEEDNFGLQDDTYDVEKESMRVSEIMAPIIIPLLETESAFDDLATEEDSDD